MYHTARRTASKTIWTSDHTICQDLRRLVLCRRFLQVVGPPLHHFSALRQVLGVVVSSSDAVAFTVGELPFDYIRPEFVLVQDGAGGAAESVAGGAGMIAHAVESIQH